MRIAEAGIEELQKYVDTLIIIPNQNLFRVANERTTFADAFKMADDVLHSGVRGVTDLMVMPGLINLDFADIRTVMSEMGKAMMGTGEAEGERRAIDAAEAAISNPLLEDVSMKGARGVLINITGGPDMTLFEVDEAANRIREEVDPDANIIFGSTFDEKLAGRMRISVVATGIDAEARTQEQARAGARRARRRQRRRAARHRLRLHAADADAERGAPAVARRRPRRTGRAPRRGRSRRTGLPAAEAAESAAVRGGAFIAPRPVDAGPGPAGAADAAGGAAGRRRRARRRAAAEGARAEPDRAGHRRRPRPPGRRRRRSRARRRRRPPRRGSAPAQPRLAPLEPEERPGAEQGRRSARHSGLPAPPGELNARKAPLPPGERRLIAQRCGGCELTAAAPTPFGYLRAALAGSCRSRIPAFCDLILVSAVGMQQSATMCDLWRFRGAR